MKLKLRKAVAMVELIFAIVIMGLTLTSIPLLIAQTQKSAFVAFQQESIAMVATHTNLILTYPWDEQNSESKIVYIKNILETNGSSELNSTNRETPTFPLARNRSFSTGGFASIVSDDVNDTSEDDIDDFNNDVSSLRLLTSTSQRGSYIDVNVSILTTVTYGDDTTTYSATPIVFDNPLNSPLNTITNIKLITTNLTSNSITPELNKNITLFSFMCNIGATTPLFLGGF